MFNSEIITIHQECEGGIEKTVLRIAVWHHEACRVMINGDREGRINNGFFFLLTTSFILEKPEKDFQKILNTLRCHTVM